MDYGFWGAGTGMTRRGSAKTEADGQSSGLGAVRHRELAEDVADVPFGCSATDEEEFGNLLVGLAASQ